MHEGSDPKFTLVVAQSIVENGTIKLDNYQDGLLLGDPFQHHVGDAIRLTNGHYYNYFPIGPSIMTLPVVAAAKAMGFDMRLGQHNYRLQRALAAITSVIMLWIVYGIARCFLDVKESILIAGISVMGSGLISTLGSALWSINFSTIFIGLSLLLLVRYETERSGTVHPIILGLLLFLSYFARASSAAFIFVVLVYLLIKERKALITTGATALFLLLLFAGWSRLEYGTWLPAYYSASRFQGDKLPLLIAIYGHLFSPSRGIFVFSPFFLLVIAGLVLFRRRIYRQPLVWLAIGWFILHILASSTAVSWWAGYSYGPRILTETVLALVLLTVILWSMAKEHLNPLWNKFVVALFLVLGAVAIFIHSYQGMYNINTAGWNEKFVPLPTPPIVGLDGLFDWRYPQFLASGDGLCNSQEERMRDILVIDNTLGAYRWGSPITFLGDAKIDYKRAAYDTQHQEKKTPANEIPVTSGAPLLQAGTDHIFLPTILTKGNEGMFIGWTDTRARKHIPYRWSECERASIVFRLADIREVSDELELAITAGANGEQRTTVLLNGESIGEWLFTSPPLEPETALFNFDKSLLKPNELNEITFQLPDAYRIDKGQWRRMGLSFYQLAIYPIDESPVPWSPPPEKSQPAYP